MAYNWQKNGFGRKGTQKLIPATFVWILPATAYLVVICLFRCQKKQDQQYIYSMTGNQYHNVLEDMDHEINPIKTAEISKPKL